MATTNPLPALWDDPAADLDVDAWIGWDDTEAHHDDERVPARPQFTIDNERAAEWAMRRVAEASTSAATARALYDEWKQQLDDWLFAVTRAPARSLDLFTPMLEHYQRQRRLADDKAKTLMLPSGKVTSTKPTVEAKATLIDEKAATVWAEKHAPQIVNTKSWVNVTDLREVTRVIVVRDSDGNVASSMVVDGAGNAVPGMGVELSDITCKVVPG